MSNQKTKPAGRLTRAAAVGLIIGSMSLGGCSARPGVAAEVNGLVISETQVQEVADSAIGHNQDRSVVVTQLIFNEIALPVVQQHDLVASPERLEQQLREMFRLSETTEISPAVVHAFSGLYVKEDASPKQIEAVKKDLADYMSQVDVTINPRYGTFDLENGISEARPSWLIVKKLPAEMEAG